MGLTTHQEGKVSSHLGQGARWEISDSREEGNVISEERRPDGQKQIMKIYLSGVSSFTDGESEAQRD